MRPIKLKFIAMAMFGAALALTSLKLAAEETQTTDWQAPARAARKKNPVPADDKSIAAGKSLN